MDTIRIPDKKGVKLIAHRGLSAFERENTNAAFVAAGNRSYYGIETDLHKTSDGRYVLIHDDTTGRVATDDIPVELSTYDALRSLTLTDRGGIVTRTDLRIPSLEEYIGINKKYGKVAVLELKSIFSREEIWDTCAVIESLGYLESVIFISFSYENLVFLREKYQDQAAQFLVSKYDESLIGRLKAHKLDLDIRESALNAVNTAFLKSEGITINCWTVDNVTRAEELISYGVDMITTNILE